MIFLLKEQDGSRRRIKQSEAVDDYISRPQLELLAEKLRSNPTEKFVFCDGPDTLTVTGGHTSPCRPVNRNVAEAIRGLCARENWYNIGSVPMFENMLFHLVPESDPVEVARDIHANTRQQLSAEDSRDLLREIVGKVTEIYREYRERSRS